MSVNLDLLIEVRNRIWPKGVDVAHAFSARAANQPCRVCAQMLWHRLHKDFNPCLGEQEVGG